MVVQVCGWLDAVLHNSLCHNATLRADALWLKLTL